MARVFAQREWDRDQTTLISWAMACSAAALKLYREGGRDKKKHIKHARGLFRDALSRGADERTTFLVCTSMEVGHRDIATARACFEEWRSRGGGGDGEFFWAHYAWFERQHGTAARARAVAEAAIAACPRDPAVFALYANLELRMGCDARARRVVGRSRDVFAADEDAVKWISNRVEDYRRYLREAAARPTIGDLFRCVFIFCCRGGSG